MPVQINHDMSSKKANAIDHSGYKHGITDSDISSDTDVSYSSEMQDLSEHSFGSSGEGGEIFTIGGQFSFDESIGADDLDEGFSDMNDFLCDELLSEASESETESETESESSAKSDFLQLAESSLIKEYMKTKSPSYSHYPHFKYDVKKDDLNCRRRNPFDDLLTDCLTDDEVSLTGCSHLDPRRISDTQRNTSFLLQDPPVYADNSARNLLESIHPHSQGGSHDNIPTPPHNPTVRTSYCRNITVRSSPHTRSTPQLISEMCNTTLSNQQDLVPDGTSPPALVFDQYETCYFFDRDQMCLMADIKNDENSTASDKTRIRRNIVEKKWNNEERKIDISMGCPLLLCCGFFFFLL